MPIGYSDESHGGDLVNRPRVFCDWCDQPIQDARDGNVYWFQNDQTVLYFNHKRCARAHEEHLRDSSGVGLPLSEDLDTFFSYLLVNVGMEAI